MHKPIIEIMYIGVEYVLIALMLVAASYALSVRNDIALSRNREIEQKQKIAQYLKYQKYDQGDHETGCDNDIFGDEVIACIRDYCDDPMFSVYVDMSAYNGFTLRVDKAGTDADPGISSLSYLKDRIPSTAKYHPYVVYDSVPPETVNEVQSGKTVTGICFRYVGG